MLFTEVVTVMNFCLKCSIFRVVDLIKHMQEKDA